MSNPDYLVRSVKEIDGKKRGINMSVAYRTAKGMMTVYLSALPINDRIFLIPVKRIDINLPFLFFIKIIKNLHFFKMTEKHSQFL
jgi:hypothetical protein